MNAAISVLIQETKKQAEKSSASGHLFLRHSKSQFYVKDNHVTQPEGPSQAVWVIDNSLEIWNR
jgi:hypothetical protein